MSFNIEPKERDFRLRINGIGNQTLSVADCKSLVSELKQNPHSVDLKGVQLFLRHEEQKCIELRTILENAIWPERIATTVEPNEVEPIVYPFPEEENESSSFVDEEEEE